MARILLVNKFYYPRGGDCTACIGLENLLKERGHSVAIFSTKHPQNINSEWSNYFPSSISFFGSLKNKLSAVSRPFYSQEVKINFLKLIKDFNPDIIHVHNIHSYLSPYVVKIASEQNIRVVWTLHDYKLICPAYSCLRNDSPCELCFTEKKNVIKHRCIKNSISASIIAYFEAIIWNKHILEKSTNMFISPSQFLKSKMIKAGYADDKISVLHNFIHVDSPIDSFTKEDYYCYVGRLSPEKGIYYLLEAAKDLPFRLKVIGGGDNLAQYKEKYKNYNIDFLGHLPIFDVLKVIQKAIFTVVPSVCYENNPFSIIESLCMGTPILGSRTGGIPELIEENENGYLFSPKDIDELKNKINICFETFNNDFDFNKIAQSARNKFSKESYYVKLMQIYNL